MTGKRIVIDKLRRWIESTKNDAYRARNTPLILSPEEIKLLEKKGGRKMSKTHFEEFKDLI